MATSRNNLNLILRISWRCSTRVSLMDNTHSVLTELNRDTNQSDRHNTRTNDDLWPQWLFPFCLHPVKTKIRCLPTESVITCDWLTTVHKLSTRPCLASTQYSAYPAKPVTHVGGGVSGHENYAFHVSVVIAVCLSFTQCQFSHTTDGHTHVRNNR